MAHNASIKTTFLTASVSRRAGGLFDAVRQLARSLDTTQEVDMALLGLTDEFTEQDKSAWHPIEPRVHHVRGPEGFGYAPGLSRDLARLNPDLVHAQGIWMYPSMANSRWSRRSGKPHLVSPHGMLDPWALRHSRFKKQLAALLFENGHLRRAACLHALCPQEGRAIRSYGLKNPVCVIPNGIDLPSEEPTQPPPWQGIIPEGMKVLLYLGRLHPKKNLLRLVEAWNRMCRRNPSPASAWSLALIGWDQGDYESTLKTAVRDAALEASVYFLGPQFGASKAAACQAASAFILPSVSEGLPMSVLEAWAWRLPVLMTPECNLTEGFETGAALPLGTDVDGLTAGLERLIAMSDSERQQMGRCGRELVEQRFSWPIIATQMRQVYDWVLGGGPRPATVQQ